MRRINPRPKLVFVAHPVSGDVEGNLALITKICREIHTKSILPVFPSFTTRRYLTPSPEDRHLAEIQRTMYIMRVVDELWLFGQKVSAGMENEVKLAFTVGLPVRGKTAETKEWLRQYKKSRPR